MTLDEIILPPLLDGEDKGSPLKNCIRNNYRHLRKWARRTLTDAFRLYDRDIKEYPLAIDLYAGRFCIHYFSTDRAEEGPPLSLQEELKELLFALFGAPPTALFWRSRVKRGKVEQYEKMGTSGQFFAVMEHGVKFKVNLEDYLDTGLFLDHRKTRQMVAALANKKRLLNLFAYTCSFTVHAALHGAASTTSVDLSNRYTEWGRDHFAMNGIPLDHHTIIRADCLRFLEEKIHSKERFDIIVIDPPTISRSKKMEKMFDIQEDYPHLLRLSHRLLAPCGIIFFSTNSRRFQFDSSLFPESLVQDITKSTIPNDFHRAKIHRCWKISSREPC